MVTPTWNVLCKKHGLPLQHKGDEPFRVPHIFLIPLAQMFLEDALFHTDTVAQANQRTSHDDKQTQPVRQAESKSEQDDEKVGIGGMPNESVGFPLRSPSARLRRPPSS
ncbi:MAG TPA: hypothetical protein VGL94_05670 [Ktedonobacteraceae bacterium]